MVLSREKATEAITYQYSISNSDESLIGLYTFLIRIDANNPDLWENIESKFAEFAIAENAVVYSIDYAPITSDPILRIQYYQRNQSRDKIAKELQEYYTRIVGWLSVIGIPENQIQNQIKLDSEIILESTLNKKRTMKTSSELSFRQIIESTLQENNTNVLSEGKELDTTFTAPEIITVTFRVKFKSQAFAEALHWVGFEDLKKIGDYKVDVANFDGSKFGDITLYVPDGNVKAAAKAVSDKLKEFVPKAVAYVKKNIEGYEG